MGPLSGRVAIVTGAAQGIGRGIAICLARDGADVVLVDVNEQGALEVAAEMADLGKGASAVRCDVTDAAQVAEAVERGLARFGQIDILINNAGVEGAPGWDRELRSRLVDWDVAFAVNLKAHFLFAEAVAPHMTARRYGKIVNIASSAARVAAPFYPHYNASKAGVISYTQCLALQLAPYDVNVNAICPGMVWTPMQSAFSSSEGVRRWQGDVPDESGQDARAGFLARVARRCPLRRETTPEDIGWTVAFLVSERARNITGQTIHVDGGAVMP